MQKQIEKLEKFRTKLTHVMFEDHPIIKEFDSILSSIKEKAESDTPPIIYIPNKFSTTSDKNKVVEYIRDTVCELTGVKKELILTNCRKREIVYSRDLVRFILRRTMKMEYQLIADLEPNHKNSHATIHCSVAKIKKLLLRNKTKMQYKLVSDIKFVNNKLIEFLDSENSTGQC